MSTPRLKVLNLENVRVSWQVLRGSELVLNLYSKLVLRLPGGAGLVSETAEQGHGGLRALGRTGRSRVLEKCPQTLSEGLVRKALHCAAVSPWGHFQLSSLRRHDLSLQRPAEAVTLLETRCWKQSARKAPCSFTSTCPSSP